MKKHILLLLLINQISVTYAGMQATTVHSRANCINNESITWWYNHPYDWRVISIHSNPEYHTMHMIDTGYSYTWRCAAVHWGEGTDNSDWHVDGYHYLYDYANGKIPFDITMADDCSIYNGWWDK